MIQITRKNGGCDAGDWTLRSQSGIDIGSVQKSPPRPANLHTEASRLPDGTAPKRPAERLVRSLNKAAEGPADGLRPPSAATHLSSTCRPTCPGVDCDRSVHAPRATQCCRFRGSGRGGAESATPLTQYPDVKAARLLGDRAVHLAALTEVGRNGDHLRAELVT